MRTRGYVYFVQAKRCRLIKIGFSVDPLARLRDLQGMSPDQLILLVTTRGSIDDEQRYHVEFAKFRKHGEWFRPARALLDHIDTLLRVREVTRPRKHPAIGSVRINRLTGLPRDPAPARATRGGVG